MGKNDFMFYVLDWFKKYTAKELHNKLIYKKYKIAEKTIYNYKARMKKAQRTAKELTKDW